MSSQPDPQFIDTKGGEFNPNVQPAELSGNPPQGGEPNTATPNPAPVASEQPQAVPQSPAPVAPQPTAHNITPDQVTAAVEKARQEEKEKLYGKISSLESSLEESKQLIKSLQKGIDKDLNVDELTKVVAKEAAKAANQKSSEQIATLQAQVEKLAAQNAELMAKELRDRLIAQNGGKTAMIVELVRGTTEQEILDSIQTAKRVRETTLQEAGYTPAPNTPSAPSPNLQQAPDPATSMPNLPSVDAPTPRTVDALNPGVVKRYKPGEISASERQERLKQAAEQGAALMQAASPF